MTQPQRLRAPLETRPRPSEPAPSGAKGGPPEHHDRPATAPRPHHPSADRRVTPLAGPLLPHEIAWAGFFLVVLGCLGFERGIDAPETLIWLALATLTAVPLVVGLRRPGVGTWRARLFVFLLVMNAAYFRMGAVVAATGRRLRDAELQALDQRLFGGVLPVLVGRFQHPLAGELLSACYFLLFPYILLSCVRWAARVRTTLGTAQRFYAGLFALYAVGFLGYLLVPARGAWLDLPHAFTTPVAGGWIARLNDAVVRRGTNHVDVFPSLHVAASAYMLLFDFRHDPPRARRWLLPVLGLWVSTIYLRYHYGVDVIAGFLLAAAALVLADRWPARASALHPPSA